MTDTSKDEVVAESLKMGAAVDKEVGVHVLGPQSKAVDGYAGAGVVGKEELAMREDVDIARIEKVYRCVLLCDTIGLERD